LVHLKRLFFCGRGFGIDEEVKEAVHTWIRQQSKTFSDGIRKLVDGKQRRVELQEDC